MTIPWVRESADKLTVIYIPLLAWSFIALALYGMASVVIDISAQPAGPGPLIALALLGGFTLFVAATAGQLVVCSFERRAGYVRLRRYGLRGLATDERPLSEVTGLQIRVLRRAQHRIDLQLRSGERLPLTPYYVVSPGLGALRRLSDYLGFEPALVQEKPFGRR